jgi:ABC-type Mn2+/Zn2+ transport system ATPase subunit
MSEPLVRFKNAAFGYGRRVVLQGVDLSIPRGDFLGIIGPNGGGKTTLLRGLLGLLRPREGSVEFPAGRPRFGYVPQRQHLDELFPLTVREIVLMGRYGRIGPVRRPGRRDREAADEAMDTAGILPLAGNPYRNLSGGQKQRCLLARALASHPDLLVLDEPTNDMDIAAEERTMRLIDRVCGERGITVVMVSHLLNVVLNHACTLMLVGYGQLRAGPIDEMVTPEALETFYGIPMTVGAANGRRIVLAAPAADDEGKEETHE